MEIFKRLYEAGGAITVLIILAGFFTMYLIFERFYHFHRARIDVNEFLQGLTNNLRHQNIVEAIKICEETPGPVPHLARVAITRADQPESTLREAMRDAALNEIPRLEKNLTVLATIASLTPLLGLLGTVLGMIGAFNVLNSAGINASASGLAGNIEMALYTSAAGLTVAIPAYGFYNILHRKVQDIILDMEKVANELIYFFSHNRIDISDFKASQPNYIQNDLILEEGE